MVGKRVAIQKSFQVSALFGKHEAATRVAAEGDAILLLLSLKQVAPKLWFFGMFGTSIGSLAFFGYHYPKSLRNRSGPWILS